MSRIQTVGVPIGGLARLSYLYDVNRRSVEKWPALLYTLLHRAVMGDQVTMMHLNKLGCRLDRLRKVLG